MQQLGPSSPTPQPVHRRSGSPRHGACRACRRSRSHGADDSRSQFWWPRRRRRAENRSHLRHGCLLVLARRPAAARASAETRGGREVVAAFYPLAFAAERVGGETADEPDAPGRRAARRGAVRPGRRAGALGRTRPLPRLRLPAGARRALDGADGESSTCSRGSTSTRASAADDATGEGGEALDPHVWLDPVRCARIVERIGAALDRPAAAARMQEELLRLDGTCARGWRTARGARSSPATPRSAIWRAVRARADRAHRARAGGRADPPRAGARDRRGARARGDDRLLRDARLAETRRDGGARGRRQHGRARSARRA